MNMKQFTLDVREAVERSQKEGNGQILYTLVVSILKDKGYGNVKQAVKEFAERLKDFIFQNSSIGCLTIGGEERPHSQVSCAPEAIENYIDEVLEEYENDN